MYKGEFTIEDFDAAKADLERQGVDTGPMFYLVGTIEQVQMGWDAFEESMIKAINKVINTPKS